MKKAIALVLIATFVFNFPTSSALTTATFYTPPYLPSACYGFEDKGIKIAAASDAIWDNGNACGRRYRVTCSGATNDGVVHPCTGESVTVTITDRCPDPVCQGTIDLSQEAFEHIADPRAGKIRIDLIEI